MSEETKPSNDVLVLLLSPFFIGVFVDVFLIKYTLDWGSDIRLFIFLLLWLFSTKVLHFTSIATFKLVLILFIVLSVLFIFFPDQPSTERLASWVYIYMVVGVIQQLFESRKSEVTNA